MKRKLKTPNKLNRVEPAPLLRRKELIEDKIFYESCKPVGKVSERVHNAFITGREAFKYAILEVENELANKITHFKNAWQEGLLLHMLRCNPSSLGNGLEVKAIRKIKHLKIKELYNLVKEENNEERANDSSLTSLVRWLIHDEEEAHLALMYTARESGETANLVLKIVEQWLEVVQKVSPAFQPNLFQNAHCTPRESLRFILNTSWGGLSESIYGLVFELSPMVLAIRNLNFDTAIEFAKKGGSLLIPHKGKSLTPQDISLWEGAFKKRGLYLEDVKKSDSPLMDIMDVVIEASIGIEAYARGDLSEKNVIIINGLNSHKVYSAFQKLNIMHFNERGKSPTKESEKSNKAKI